MFLTSATLVVGIATLSWVFVPYLYFYKNNSNGFHGRIFLASNYEGPPQVDSTDRTTEEINRERRELIGKKLASPGFDRQNVIILEEPSPISAQFGMGSLDVVHFAPTKLEIKTSSGVPKLLFVGESFYGWKAKVDGDSAKIFRANYSFRAVPITSGEHTVVFYWNNMPIYFGLLTTSLLFTAGFIISARSRLRD